MTRVGFRPREVAEQLGCSSSKVYDLIARKELPAFKLGKKVKSGVRVRPEDLERFVNERVVT